MGSSLGREITNQIAEDSCRAEDRGAQARTAKVCGCARLGRPACGLQLQIDTERKEVTKSMAKSQVPGAALIDSRKGNRSEQQLQSELPAKFLITQGDSPSCFCLPHG